jgi:hypothetical protein
MRDMVIEALPGSPIGRLFVIVLLLFVIECSFMGSLRCGSREGRLKVASVADRTAGRRAANEGSVVLGTSAATVADRAGEDVVEVVACCGEGGTRCLGKAAIDSILGVSMKLFTK